MPVQQATIISNDNVVISRKALDPDDKEARDYLVKIGEIKE